MDTTKTNDSLTKTLIDDLHTWGPALTREIWSRYPVATISELLTAKVMVNKKFSGFAVYVLSGLGLRPYGYSLRYNYVPAKNVVLGALIVRAMARQYQQNGYEMQLHDGYAKRGRDNILLARKSGQLVVVICRASTTMKAVRVIVNVLSESLSNISAVHAVVLQGDHDPLLVSGKTVNEIPFQLVQLPVTQLTREPFAGNAPQAPEAGE